MKIKIIEKIMRSKKRKRIEDWVDEEYLYFKCPKCEEIIKIPRCRNCVHIEMNMTDYHNSKCKECDMFHINFKRKK